MSDKKVTVYKIHNGKLVSSEARETSKMFIFTEREWEFGCVKSIYKNEASLTPQEAILARRNSLLTSVGICEDRIKASVKELNSLKTIEENI